MIEGSYLQWIANETPTKWWHDSAEPNELKRGLFHGAVGVTTNPVLAASALLTDPARWARAIQGTPKDSTPERKAEVFMRAVVCNAAEMLMPIFRSSAGESGYVCAQVNPDMAGDRQAMTEMAERFAAWAPNIAVKLPATAAGLDVLEECAARGMTVTATVSFTVPQVIAVAERYRRGLARARKTGGKSGKCFAVIMMGRLDDYLEGLAKDSKARVGPSDIQQAGIAVAKRAYWIYKQRGYEAVLLVAALRGTHHATELAGAEVIISIHPKYQEMLLKPGVPRDLQRAMAPVADEVIKRLEEIPDFVRAYEPDGMGPEEFIRYGVTQRTLAQFQAAWLQIEAMG